MPISCKTVQRLTYLLLTINSMFEFNSLPWQWSRFVKILLQNRITSQELHWQAELVWLEYSAQHSFIWDFVRKSVLAKYIWHRATTKLRNLSVDLIITNRWHWWNLYSIWLTSFLTCMTFAGKLRHNFRVDCAPVSSLWNVKRLIIWQ